MKTRGRAAAGSFSGANTVAGSYGGGSVIYFFLLISTKSRAAIPPRYLSNPIFISSRRHPASIPANATSICRFIHEGNIMRPSLALKTTGLFVALFFLSGLAGCGVQSIPKALNQVEASVAEVTNQYKRRADLIPNLVNTVKGYASHEKETLEAVVNARASATSVKIDPSNSSPEQIQKFQQAQGGLSQALGRLMVVSERYPDLKADRNFRELQAQLEGTENRITIARQRHIESIKQFNDLVTVPPSSLTNSLFYHHDKMAQWALDEAEQKAVEQTPEVQF